MHWSAERLAASQLGETGVSGREIGYPPTASPLALSQCAHDRLNIGQAAKHGQKDESNRRHKLLYRGSSLQKASPFFPGRELHSCG